MYRPRQQYHRYFSQLIPFLLLSLSFAAGAEKSLPTPGTQLLLVEHQAKYLISNQAYIVHDPEQRWDPVQLATGEQDYRELLRQPHSEIHVRGGTYWLILAVKNLRRESEWRLNFMHGRTDTIDVLSLPLAYRANSATKRFPGGVEQLSGGMAQPPESRQITGFGHRFPLQIPAGDTRLLLIRTASHHYLNGLYVFLEEAGYSEQRGFVYQATVFGLLGLMLGLAIYNLFICTVTRDINYLWYSLFALMLTTCWASYYGLLWSLFGIHDASRFVIIYAQFGMLFFTLLFTRGFLNLRLQNRRLDDGFYLLLGLITVFGLLTPFLHAAYIFKVYWGLMLLASIITIAASISCMKRGYRPARFLILGQLVVAFGIFETGLAYLGVYSYEAPVPERFTAQGALEMLLLSMALADRINQLRDEKRIAEEANQLKSDFLALITHEIRTPLHGLLSMIKLLGRTVLGERQRGYVTSMDYSGKALLSLLNGVLDYSRLEANRLELEHCAFDPRLLVESLAMLMLARASEKGLILSTHIDRGLPPRVFGDPNRLRQVLLNLIGNAIKFTDRGVVKVSLRQISRDASDISLKFEVEDSGIGIAEEDRERIFELFTQGDSSVTRRFGGTGLGLSICKRILENMNSCIELDSRRGCGSTFHFTLTLPYSEEAPKPPQADDDNTRNDHSLKILLVDDVEINRVAAAGLLEHEGHKVVTAGSAREAFTLLDEQRFDLILMDIHMPDMDGVTATRLIRRRPDPQTANLPIIALTANTHPEQAKEYFAAGVDSVASKPLEMDQLLETLGNLSRKAEAAQARGPHPREDASRDSTTISL